MTVDRKSLVLLALCAVAATTAPAAEAQQREVPDTYTAVTVNMEPAGVELKADILRWSTSDERAAVVQALTESKDVVVALRALPSVGAVWHEGGVIGHAIKYAHRASGNDGSETITLVTDRRIGVTSFRSWTAEVPVRETPLEYSVVVMTTGSEGTGTMSLAAEPVIDAQAATITLDTVSATPVLSRVTKQPPPYWVAE